MIKYNLGNRILVFALLVVMLFCSVAQQTHGKYVYESTGKVVTSLISGKIFTNTFVITDEKLGDKGSVMSNNLHGVAGSNPIDLTNTGGSYIIDAEQDVIEENGLASAAEKIFVVQNNSSKDLVACFDIILCMGWISTSELTCTLTEVTSGTSLVLTASLNKNNQNSDITLKHHKETTDTNWNEFDDGVDIPEITVKFGSNSILGGFVDYSAYSFQINPSNHRGDDVAADNDNLITEEEFKNFIIIPAGQTKTFTISITSTSDDYNNCFAQMTMTTIVLQE